MMRGRWNDARTARIYLTDGLAQLATLQLSEESHTLCGRLAIECRPDLALD